jgi:hypothetical protein
MVNVVIRPLSFSSNIFLLILYYSGVLCAEFVGFINQCSGTSWYFVGELVVLFLLNGYYCYPSL